MARICSFSSAAADLKRQHRHADGILAALRQDPRISCFDLSQYAWLRDGVRTLERRGQIRDDGKEAYPWVRYLILEPEKGVTP
jgi:hypothetical protein